jgi:hypothetical protein
MYSVSALRQDREFAKTRPLTLGEPGLLSKREQNAL